VKFTQLLTETYEGAPGGMNLALPSQEIDELGARYMQDILLHRPGLMVRRGPVRAISGYAVTPKPASGLAQTLDPGGSFRIAALYGDASSGSLGLYSTDFSTITAVPWNGFLPTTGGAAATAYRIVDAKAALTGGTWIGSSSQYDASNPTQTLALWRGGIKADYSTGTITVARGGVAVTGAGTSWLTNVTPGEFLFANTDDPYTLAYLGVVKSVNSDTSITLGAAAPYACTAKAYNATSIRGFCPRVVTGRITTSTGSTQVNGASTKFLTQGVNSGTWQLYRASDLGFIGKVSSVTNDSTIVLAANAALATANERYILIRVDGDYSINTQAVSGRKVGFLTSLYASRQWFANLGQQYETVARVYFSDPSDPEAVDLSPFDGDFIDVASTTGVNTPIKALMPAYNALLVIKDTETFGIYGASKSQFQVRKIEDDGTLSGMSVQPYGGGVIWAGRDGIYYYDGIEAKNITLDSLGDYYKNAVRSFDPTAYRMWSFIDRDHYFLFMEHASPNTGPVKGTVSTTPTAITICINMTTKAVTVQTNVAPRGAISLPATTGETTWLVQNDAITGKGCLVDASVLFDEQGNDTIRDTAFSLGPDFYFESKKYKVGDSLRKKLFKQLAINYLAQGGVADSSGVIQALQLDTVIGLNNVGKTSLTKFPATVYTWDQLPSIAATWDDLAALFPSWDALVLATFNPKRIKFLKRSQHMAFRIYQTSTTAVTQVQLGPFQLGFKLQRPGRV
jgi:hypothetical protein